MNAEGRTFFEMCQTILDFYFYSGEPVHYIWRYFYWLRSIFAVWLVVLFLLQYLHLYLRIRVTVFLRVWPQWWPLKVSCIVWNLGGVCNGSPHQPVHLQPRNAETDLCLIFIMNSLATRQIDLDFFFFKIKVLLQLLKKKSTDFQVLKTKAQSAQALVF